MTQQIFWNSAPPTEDKTPCYVFYKDQLLVTEDATSAVRLTWETLKNWDHLTTQTTWRLYTHQGEMVYLIDLSEAYAPQNNATANTEKSTDRWQLKPLKPVYRNCDAQEAAQISQAYQIIYFHRTHQYCSICGMPLKNISHAWAKHCPDCKHTFYPDLSPVVMVLIHRENRILLAHHRRPHAAFYTTLAGFLEPGETLEEAIMREVHEEVGLRIKNLRYFKSQSWPFPHSIIAAFHADYASGEIKVDGEEIAHADWFGRDNLPCLPPKGSIARQLIESL